MKQHYKKYIFDTNKYNFYNLLSSLFNHQNLETIHEKLGDLEQFTMANNSNTECHKAFYAKLKEGWPELESMYESFLSEFILEIVGEEFIFQKWPTLRTHVPNNWATPEYHRDSQEGYNHPHGEINFLLPFTKCHDTNTLWSESEADKGDFQPIQMEWGELVTFNGNQCRHGNKINKTPISRVTCDFRVLPLSKYDPDDIKVSHTTGTRFELGHYYKKLRHPEQAQGHFPDYTQTR